MKNILSVILSVTILFSTLSIGVFAEEKTDDFVSGYGSTLTVLNDSHEEIGEKSKELCFIRNEFYAVFCNNYFEAEYDEYNYDYDTWVKNDDLSDNSEYESMKLAHSSDGTAKAKLSLVNEIENSNKTFYLSVILTYSGEINAENNRTIGESLFDGAEVIYSGDTAPCVVIALKGGTDLIEKTIENESVLFVETAFELFPEYSVDLAIFEETFKPTSKDARYILRYSARLENVPRDRGEAKKFFYMSDSDFDGKITVADARRALRISAGLENGKTFYKSGSGGGEFWNLF